MTNDSDCPRSRASRRTNDLASIEEAMKMLDDLRDDLDAATAETKETAAKALLRDIKALAVTIDEIVAQQKIGADQRPFDLGKMFRARTSGTI